MTHKCAAVGCNSVKNGKTAVMFHRYILLSTQTLNISNKICYCFFRFPLKDPIRMFEWLKLCPPGTDPEKARIALCSKHFRRDQYLNITAKRPRLYINIKCFNLITSQIVFFSINQIDSQCSPIPKTLNVVKWA